MGKLDQEIFRDIGPHIQLAGDLNKSSILHRKKCFHMIFVVGRDIYSTDSAFAAITNNGTLAFTFLVNLLEEGAQHFLQWLAVTIILKICSLICSYW